MEAKPLRLIRCASESDYFRLTRRPNIIPENGKRISITAHIYADFEYPHQFELKKTRYSGGRRIIQILTLTTRSKSARYKKVKEKAMIQSSLILHEHRSKKEVKAKGIRVLHFRLFPLLHYVFLTIITSSLSC